MAEALLPRFLPTSREALIEYVREHYQLSVGTLDVLLSEVDVHFCIACCLHQELGDCLFILIKDHFIKPERRYRLDSSYASDLSSISHDDCDSDDAIDDCVSTDENGQRQSGEESEDTKLSTAVDLIAEAEANSDDSDDIEISAEIARKFGFVRNKRMDTLLHCPWIRPSMAKILLTEVGLDVNLSNIHQTTPLHVVAAKSNAELVMLYTEHGADVNARDENGHQPLHLAKIGQIVRLLCAAGSDPRSRDQEGHTILHRIQLDDDFIEAALQAANDKAGYFIENCLNIRGNAPLHCTTAFEPFPRLFPRTSTLSAKNYGVHARNYCDQTPLITIAHQLASYPLGPSTVSFVSDLIQQYKYDFNDRDIFGNTCMHYLFQNPTSDGLRSLISAVDVDLEIRNNEGVTPVGSIIRQNLSPSFYAILCRIAGAFESLENKYKTEIIDRFGLGKSGTSDDQTASDKINTSPVDGGNYVEKLGQLDNMGVMHDIQGWLNVQDDSGRTLLHYLVFYCVASGDEEETIEKMIQAGANADLIDKQGLSSRTLLAASRDTEISSELYGCTIISSSSESRATSYTAKNTDYSNSGKNIKILFIRKNVAEVQLSYQKIVRQFVRTNFIRETGGVAEKLESFDFKNIGLYDNLERIWSRMKLTDVEISYAFNLRSSLVSFLNAVLTLVSSEDFRFASSLVPAGSSHEGTQVGFTNEFDFMVSLDGIAEDFEVVAGEKSTSAIMLHLKPESSQDIIEKWSEFLDEEAYLIARKLLMKFHALVLKTLSKESIRTQYPFIIIRQYFDKWFAIDFGPAMTFELLALPEAMKTDGDNRIFILKSLISVDLAPAINLSHWWPTETRKRFEDFSVPNSCVPLYAVFPKYWTELYEDNTNAYLLYFRVSFAAVESEILRSAPSVCRDALTLAKFLSRQEKPSISSNNLERLVNIYDTHQLKMSLIYNITTNQLEYLKQKVDTNWDNTVFWCGKIFATLFNFADDDILPNYFNKDFTTRLWACDPHPGYSRNLYVKLGLDKYVSGTIPLPVYHWPLDCSLFYMRETIVHALCLAWCFYFSYEERRLDFHLPDWIENLIIFVDRIFKEIPE